jgi:hypothetical protein
MPIEGKSLEAVSRKFCDNLNRLLAKTISQQRLVALTLPGRGVNIAFRQSGIADTAKLKTHFGEMELFIGLLCGAAQIKRNRFRPFVSEYRYTLTPKGSADPLCRWEYVRKWPRDTDRWCRHHVQGDIPVSIGGQTISLNDLHLPTGYVTLEEIIRFCLVDLGVKPLSPDWHAILEKSYRQFKLEPYSA